MATSFITPSPVVNRSVQLRSSSCRQTRVVRHAMRTKGRSYVTMCEAADEDGDVGMMQGPTQAPTKAGVSTVGLSEREAAFVEACFNTEVQKVEEFLNDGIDISVADVNGRTALHFLAGNGVQTLCKRVIEMGGDMNKQDLMGFTPLHMAAGYRMVSTVKLLVESGADANIADYKGKLPVEMAEEMLEKAPKKKFFMDNPDYVKLEEIVEILDEATEEEDDEELDVEEGGEFTEETDSAKFVVRVKPKGETPPTPTPVKVDDVKVTIRVKEPDAKK